LTLQLESEFGSDVHSLNGTGKDFGIFVLNLSNRNIEVQKLFLTILKSLNYPYEKLNLNDKTPKVIMKVAWVFNKVFQVQLKTVWKKKFDYTLFSI